MTQCGKKTLKYFIFSSSEFYLTFVKFSDTMILSYKRRIVMTDNGLLTNVKKNVPMELHAQLDEVSKISSIFVLYAVDIHAVTHEELVHQFASYKSRFPNRDWDSFMKYKSNWDKDKYTFDIEAMGYFADLETAMKKATNNTLDFNEAGAYPYAVICEMPLNVVYAFAEEREMCLLKYNHKTGKYEEVSWDESQGAMYLRKYGESGGFK